jgi:hypothetical protein
MPWALQIHEEVVNWMNTLPKKEYESVLAALEALKTEGPALGRPFVDHIKSSRYRNMKELRPRGKDLRLLFAFDPKRRAIVLVAGSKTNNWQDWYKENIEIADKRFEAHLRDMEDM